MYLTINNDLRITFYMDERYKLSPTCESGVRETARYEIRSGERS